MSSYASDDEFDPDSPSEDRPARRPSKPTKPRTKQGGSRRPKTWVPVDEFGEPLPQTEEQLAKLRERATNLCLWHLGRGPRSNKELHDAMTKKGVPSDMADGILEKLADYNYVNDEAFADNFVRSRHTNQRKGASVIRYELRRKGIDDDTAAQALEQITSESEHEAATQLVARKLRSTQSLDPAKRVNRLVGMLARKGYAPGLSYQVVKEALADEAEALLGEAPEHD